MVAIKHKCNFYSQFKVLLVVTSVAISAVCQTVMAANIAYIHGDVAADGTVPSGSAEPYDQMLLTDSGNTGLSMFKQLVEGQGHIISQHYDRETSLTSEFLCQNDVIIFGLHQKIWSTVEKSALDDWLNAGGGMFIYSDSASGGRFDLVGAQNPVGQTVTNNLIAQYDMQVTVDQADGTTSAQAVNDASIIALRGKRLEGEGVSPVAVAPDNATVEILIPYTRAVNQRQNLTIDNPVFAALALRPVGLGHVAVMFDRQPMWNNGPGSDIEELDNSDILANLINFLASMPSPNGSALCSEVEPPSDDICVPIKTRSGTVSLICL